MADQTLLCEPRLPCRVTALTMSGLCARWLVGQTLPTHRHFAVAHGFGGPPKHVQKQAVQSALENVEIVPSLFRLKKELPQRQIVALGG